MRQEKKSPRVKRKERIRKKLLSLSRKPRLSVFRSNKLIYAQIIDDKQGITLVSASEYDLKEPSSKKTKMEKAEIVGQILAKKAIQKGIDEVFFDRGQYQYHGRVEKLAQAARQGGLKF